MTRAKVLPFPPQTVPTFGERLRMIREILPPYTSCGSDRALAETLGLKGSSPISGWSVPNGKTGNISYPSLDTLVHIWDQLTTTVSARLNLHWFITGRGNMLDAGTPLSLQIALETSARPYSGFVTQCARVFFAHYGAALSAESWTILLDAWTAVEHKGITMAGVTPGAPARAIGSAAKTGIGDGESSDKEYRGDLRARSEDEKGRKTQRSAASKKKPRR